MTRHQYSNGDTMMGTGKPGWGHCGGNGDTSMGLWGHQDQDWDTRMGTPGWGYQDGDRDTRMRMGTLELECMHLLTSSIKSPLAAWTHHTDLGTDPMVLPPGGSDCFFPLRGLGVTPSDPSVVPGSFFGSPKEASASTGHLWERRSSMGVPHSHTGTPRYSRGLWEGVLQEEHTKILIP